MHDSDNLWESMPEISDTSHSLASLVHSEIAPKQPVSGLDPFRSSVAKVLCFVHGNSSPVGVGTGVFISDHVLLTAAHVLFDANLFGGYVHHVQIVMPGIPLPPASSFSKWVAVPPAAQTKGPPPRGVDLGVIRLGMPVVGAMPLEPTVAPDQALHNPIRLYGYPKFEYQLYCLPGQVVGADTQNFYYVAKAEQGESGGPVFAQSQLGPALVGLHIAGPGEVPQNLAAATAFRFTTAANGWINGTVLKGG